MKMYLHTLGDTLITVGETEIRPTAPMMFAALLYLGVERGRRVPRAALQELLFPEKDERSGAQSLRQLLYKLRHVGAPLDIGTSSVGVHAASVADDVSDSSPEDRASFGRAAAGILPNYSPSLSEQYATWLEAFREGAVSRVRLTLLRALQNARARGDTALIEATASALLQLDPFNEEATLARAEALALAGQKRQAVELLSSYSEEVGDTGSELAVAANVLRRRITDRFTQEHAVRPPMIGRQQEFAWLNTQFARASRGTFTLTFLWGDAGVGKTRLVNEFIDSVRLKRATIEVLQCQSGDTARPMGVVKALTERLLEMRGALGIAPDSMDVLRRFVGATVERKRAVVHDPDFATALLRNALCDLFVAVAAETPTVILIEDTHWADKASMAILRFVASHAEAAVHLVLTARPGARSTSDMVVADNVFLRQLDALPSEAATSLLDALLARAEPLDEAARAQCVSLAGGNPLFLCTIAEHLHVSGEAPDARSSLFDLLRQRVRVLADAPLLLLRCTAAMGKHATPERLQVATGASKHAFLLAAQDLAGRGLIASNATQFKVAHDLIAEVVLDDCPLSMRSLVGGNVASVLEEEGRKSRREDLLWAAGESWQFAQNTERAAEVFQCCAECALRTDQPLLACAAFERAQTCGRGYNIPLIELTLRAAERANDPQVILRNVAVLHEAARATGSFVPAGHRAYLAEICARRYMGESVWHQRSVLEQYALDERQEPSLRMKAMRSYIVVAAQHLARNEAVAFMEAAAPSLSVDVERREWLESLVYYHVLFGSLDLALQAGAELLKGAEALDVSTRARVVTNMGLLYWTIGATAPAIDLFKEAVRLSQLVGTSRALLEAYCSLAQTYIEADRLSEARATHKRVQQLVETRQFPTIAFMLSNGVKLSLAERDAVSARRYLTQLHAHKESVLPHAVRTITGYELLVTALEGHLLPQHLDLEHLQAIDRAGRESCVHTTFVLGFAQAHWLAGRRKQAISDVLEHVNVFRRERYPVWPTIRTSIADAAFRNALFTALGSGGERRCMADPVQAFALS